MAITKTLTLDREFIQKFPVLRTVREKDSVRINFQLECVDNGTLVLMNTQNKSEEIFLGVNELKDKVENLIVLNHQEFHNLLKDFSIEQELIDYQNNH